MNKVLIAVVLTAACGGAATSGASSESANLSSHAHKKVCDAGVEEMACHSWVRVDATGTPAATATPSGYGPADLQAAYNLPSATAGAGQTVAIVDAYDDPNAESDLAVYRAQFGLPPCTTANGCFRKVNQSGGTKPPRANSGWAEEISLDLDMVSAICPNCHILLVEANERQHDQPRHRGEHRRRARRQRHQQQLRRQRVDQATRATTTPTSTTPAWRSPPARATTATASSTRRRRSTSPRSAAPASSSDSTFARGWLGDGVERRGQRLQRVRRRSRPGRPTPAAPSAPWPTSRRSPTRTPASPSTTRSSTGGWLVFGGTSVASPIVASVYALAGNAGSVNYGSRAVRRTRRAQRRHLGQQRQLRRLVPLHRRRRATTAPPASARRTAPARSRTAPSSSGGAPASAPPLFFALTQPPQWPKRAL